MGGQFQEQKAEKRQSQNKKQGRERMEFQGLGHMAALEVGQGAGQAAGGAGNAGHGPQWA